MEQLTVKLQDLIEHCNEWKGEYKYVVVTINEEENTLDISGSQDFGMVFSDLDPINGIDILNDPEY